MSKTTLYDLLVEAAGHLSFHQQVSLAPVLSRSVVKARFFVKAGVWHPTHWACSKCDFIGNDKDTVSKHMVARHKSSRPIAMGSSVSIRFIT